MPKRAILLTKALLHIALLLPFLSLLQRYRSGSLALDADPVITITHFTGDWALWILLGSLAITPVRRITPRLAFLIRFRRLIGLYAFFYATLHLATYIFLFSGYDLPTAWAGVTSGHLHVLVEQWKAIWPTMVDDLQKRRFIQVGLAAWVILLALTLTSPGFVLRAVGGKNWQRLHRLVYAAAAAACIHYWWLVKAGVRSPWKDTAVLSVLLLARLVYAARKRWSRPVPVRAKVS